MLKKIYRKLHRFIFDNKPFPSLNKHIPRGELYLTHISAFSYGNAGDTLLPVVLRDLFYNTINVKKWRGLHVHKIVSDKDIKKINKSNALIIGGGGLFLKDTNPNRLSGWQWSCDIDHLEKISVPIIMFAVGYNRFRGQEDFSPIFREHLNKFVSKASFIGLRNRGSIERIKEYLEEEDLRKKVVYQPCMTTLIAKIYPKIANFLNKKDFIVFNCAFDRNELRSNNEHLLNSIAKVALKLSMFTKIKYYSHMLSDEIILPFFDKYGMSYDLVRFKTVKDIVEAYAEPKLVIGMRGHAQMIPFGCKTPILSIISHDKLKWFLDDINCSEWGIDVLYENFEDKLFEKAIELYYNSDVSIAMIEKAQDCLWNVTEKNLDYIKTIII
jgi:hypothetical protein